MPDGSPFRPLVSDRSKSADELDNTTLPKYDRHGTPLPVPGQTAEALQFKGGAWQWLRKIELMVYASDKDKGAGLDLSNLRIDFRLTKQTNSAPNFLDAKVYNLAPETMNKIRQFKKVKLSAGYKSNFGLIFDGNVVLYISGKENAVDSVVQIIAGDQDIKINNSVALLSFDAGALESDQLKAALQHAKHEVGEINTGTESQPTLRSSHYLGTVSNFIRRITNATDTDFYVDDGKAYVIPRSGYRKGEIVKLSPTTGLVGFPKVTPSGIEATCLLNPRLRIAGLVQIDTSLLSGVSFVPGSTDSAPFSSSGSMQFGPTASAFSFQGASVDPKGQYKILLLSHHGDNRGNPWYSEMVCTATGAVNAPGTALQRTALYPKGGTAKTSGDTDLGAGGGGH